MKKTALLLAMALGCTSAFCACSNTSTSGDAPITSEEVAAPVSTWVFNTDVKGNLSKDVQKVFDTATKDLTDTTYQPIALLGTQVVSGTNYKILCFKNRPSQTPADTLVILTIYNDLQGNATIDNDEIVDIPALGNGETEFDASASQDKKALAGGWTVNEDYKVTNLPADVEKIFQKAIKDTKGTHEPLALLATDEIETGTRYAVLCHSTSDSKKPVTANTVALIQTNKKGNPVSTVICSLNL